jgi:hypothetical protein
MDTSLKSSKALKTVSISFKTDFVIPSGFHGGFILYSCIVTDFDP